MTVTETTLGPSAVARIAAPIARRHGVKELYLFGSVARNEAHEDSDIDFIYRLSDDDTNASPKIRDFRNDLRQALGRDIDLTRKDYVTNAIDSDDLAELQRRAFVRNLNKHPMFRII